MNKQRLACMFELIIQRVQEREEKALFLLNNGGRDRNRMEYLWRGKCA